MPIENSGVPKLTGVGAAAKDTCYRRQARSADDAIGVRIGEVVDIGSEERVVVFGKLLIQANETEPAAIVTDVAARCNRRRNRRNACLAVVLSRREKLRLAAPPKW